MDFCFSYTSRGKAEQIILAAELGAFDKPTRALIRQSYPQRPLASSEASLRGVPARRLRIVAPKKLLLTPIAMTRDFEFPMHQASRRLHPDQPTSEERLMKPFHPSRSQPMEFVSTGQLRKIAGFGAS